MMMRVYEIKDGFGMEGLRLSSKDLPKVGPQDVLIKMKAVSLNYRDLLMVQGKYNPNINLPLVPCSDGVGEIVDAGEKVESCSVGQRVSPCFAPYWFSGELTRNKIRRTLGGPLNGTLSEYMLLHEQSVVHVPQYLSDEESATLPCAAVTAWNALFGLHKVAPGESVLIEGTGGVSIFALQFAKMMGLQAIVTSSCDKKLEKAKVLGASSCINYLAHPEWGKIARQVTGGRGVDIVIEVGGAGTLKQSMKAVRFGGTLAMIGILSGKHSQVDLTPILMNQIKMQGVLVGDKESFVSMNRAIVQEELYPVVDRTFRFEETPDAFRYLQSGKHFGKVCIAF